MSERYLVSVTIQDTVTGATRTVDHPVGEILIRFTKDVADYVLRPSYERCFYAICEEIHRRDGDV